MAESTLTTHLRGQLVRSLVQRTIMCPRTGEVLDVRTCVVINDTDGNPIAVVSQDGWKVIAAEVRTQERIAAAGWAVDPTTIKH